MVLQDLKEDQDQLDHKDHKDKQDQWDHKDHKDLRDKMDQEVMLDKEDHKVHKDHKENLDLWDHKDQEDKLDLLDHKDQKDLKDHKDHKDLKDQKDHKDQEDKTDLFLIFISKLSLLMERKFSALKVLKLLLVVVPAPKEISYLDLSHCTTTILKVGRLTANLLMHLMEVRRRNAKFMLFV